METLRLIRNQSFQEMGKKRVHRILACSLFIAIVWCFADFLSGNLKPNFRDDLICLGFGIVVERLIPWGKTINK